MGIYVWWDVYDKTEQPWEAPSIEEAREEVLRHQSRGAKNAGFWDTSNPWPFDHASE